MCPALRSLVQRFPSGVIRTQARLVRVAGSDCEGTSVNALSGMATAFWLAAGVAPAAEPAPALPPSAEWRFAVLLDGRPIGSHRFVLTTMDGRTATLTSEARFNVTLLGVPIYRYRHSASEHWQGNCLESIAASTDDDGRTNGLHGRQEADGRFAIEVRTGSDDATSEPVRGLLTTCLMTFAYWHPALADQRRLLDPSSGRLESVIFTSLPEAEMEVEGYRASVRGMRIAGLPHPIDVWYLGTRWVGLDTTVAGGRHLSYRLR